MSNLNPEQQQAADHFTGPAIVTAVPGSGKTSTLTARVMNLIAKGIEPRNICCITFTNKAAQEMKERILGASPHAKGVWVSTFHRLCLRLIRNHGDVVGVKEGFSIWDQDDTKSVMARAHRMWAAKYDEEAKLSSNDCYMLLNRINNMREAAKAVTKEEVADVDPRLVNYLNELESNNAVDFSGMLYLGWRILSKDKQTATRLSDRFKFLLVDEAQDTNDVQYAITRIIASHNNLFMVGDYQQSIFSWRNAKPENILRFGRDFPGALEITLPRNYRSRREILEHAENLIRRNHDAKNVSLVSERGTGGHISTMTYPTDREEAQDIARQLIAFKTQGYEWNDMAIIYRLNKLSRVMELALSRSSIPYLTRGGPSFFNRKEIKTTLSYLKLLTNPADSAAFREAVSYPKRGVGDALVGKIENLAKDEQISVTEAARKVKISKKITKDYLNVFLDLMDSYRNRVKNSESIGKIAYDLVRESGYRSHLEDEAEKEEDGPKSGLRIDNMDAFVSGISDFETENKNPTLDKYIQQIALVQDGDNPKRKESVNLLTMHSAKGLEFSCVFIIGCSAKVNPHYLSVNEDREPEERRLFYVAITRAKDHLQVSYHEEIPFKNSTYDPSPYLRDMMEKPQ